MATRTSVKSGLWSAADTWDTGVPANSDVAVIIAGHTVTFDVDQSGFANGVALSIRGTLRASTEPGSYYLKLSSNLVFSVTGGGDHKFEIGSEETPYPTSCTFTVDIGGDKRLDCQYGSILWYCAEPTVRWVRLTEDALAGVTELSIDADVTGEPAFWKDGAELHVNRWSAGGYQTESHSIAAGGITASTITLAVGLTATKPAGSYVILLNRNVRVIGITAISYTPFSSLQASYPCVINAEVRMVAGGYGVQGTGCQMGGVWANGVYVFSNCNRAVLTGIVTGATGAVWSYGYNCVIAETGMVCGCSTVFRNGNGHYPRIVGGKAVCCTYVGNAGIGLRVIGGEMSGGIYASLYPTDVKVYGATIENFTSVLAGIGDVTFVNTLFVNNGNDVVGRDAYYAPFESVVRSFNHNQVAGDTRAWSVGGTLTPETVVVPAGKNTAHKFTHLSALSETHMFWETEGKAGDKIQARVWAKHDIAGLAEAERIHWQVIDPSNDPIVAASASALAEWIAADSDEWQSSTLTYTRTDERPLILRACAKRASGNSYILAEMLDGAHNPIGSPIIRGLGAA